MQFSPARRRWRRRIRRWRRVVSAHATPLCDAMAESADAADLMRDVVAALRDDELTHDKAFSLLTRLDALEQHATAELVGQLAACDVWDVWEELKQLDVATASTPAQLLYNGACAWRLALARGTRDEARVDVHELLKALGALCHMREITAGGLALRVLPHVHRALEQCEESERETFVKMMHEEAQDAPRLALRLLQFANDVAKKYSLRVKDVNAMEEYSKIASGISEAAMIHGIQGACGILRQLAALTLHRLLRPGHSVREQLEHYLHVDDAGDGMPPTTLDLDILAKMTVSHLGTGRPITDAQFTHLRQMMPHVSADAIKQLTVEGAKRIGNILKRARDDTWEDDGDKRAAPRRAPAAG